MIHVFCRSGGNIREASDKSGLPLTRFINMKVHWPDLCDRIESIRVSECAVDTCYQNRICDPAYASLLQRRKLRTDRVIKFALPCQHRKFDIQRHFVPFACAGFLQNCVAKSQGGGVSEQRRSDFD